MPFHLKERFCLDCLRGDCDHMKSYNHPPTPYLYHMQVKTLRQLAKDAGSGDATNKMMAFRLGVSEGVVKLYLHTAAAAIRERFPEIDRGRASRVSLALWAIKHLAPQAMHG